MKKMPKIVKDILEARYQYIYEGVGSAVAKEAGEAIAKDVAEKIGRDVLDRIAKETLEKTGKNLSDDAARQLEMRIRDMTDRFKESGLSGDDLHAAVKSQLDQDFKVTDDMLRSGDDVAKTADNVAKGADNVKKTSKDKPQPKPNVLDDMLAAGGMAAALGLSNRYFNDYDPRSEQQTGVQNIDVNLTGMPAGIKHAAVYKIV